MANRIPLIVNSGAAQIQELAATDALSVVGNILAGNIIVTTGSTAASYSATGNITGGNLNAAGLSLSSNVVSAFNVTSNIAGGNITTPGLISAGGDITGANITTSGANATIGSSTANATYNIGTGATTTGLIKNINVGTGGTAGSTTTIAIGPVTATTAAATATFNTATTVAIANTGGSALSVAGNITGGNILGGANVNATTHTGTTVSVTGNITGGNVLGGANVNATTHTGTTVSVTGNITGGNLILNGTAAAGSAVLTVSGNIQTTTANNTSNIGNTTNYFNTVHAKATTAQYADVAELYTADAPYGAGTVLIFGGSQEVTADISSHSTAIAGVVSENPSHLMNAGLTGTHVVPVALLGRVPCQVQGTITKGDLLVASDRAGVAQRLDPAQYRPGCVIGKSLENYNSDQVGRIEIAVGVK